MSSVRVGDIVWILSQDRHRMASYVRGGSAKVQTVGRKWITLDNGMKLKAGAVLPCETYVGPKDVGLPYDVFASQSDMDAFQTQRDEAARLTRLIYGDRFRFAMSRASTDSLRRLESVINGIIVEFGNPEQ